MRRRKVKPVTFTARELLRLQHLEWLVPPPTMPPAIFKMFNLLYG